MEKIKEAASEFLANKRVAVTGVSRHPKNHGSNVVYKRLRERGYEVFAVNPNAEQVEGDRCYHDLRSIPDGVDAVVIATRPEIAEETMRECAELGIRRRGEYHQRWWHEKRMRRQHRSDGRKGHIRHVCRARTRWRDGPRDRRPRWVADRAESAYAAASPCQAGQATRFGRSRIQVCRSSPISREINRSSLAL